MVYDDKFMVDWVLKERASLILHGVPFRAPGLGSALSKTYTLRVQVPNLKV